MDASVNPLATIPKEQRRQWFKLHTERQAQEACKQWVKTVSLDDLCNLDFLPETLHVFMVDYLTGNPAKKIQRIRRAPFRLKALEPIKVGRGLNEYGLRVFDEVPKGEIEGLDAETALQIYLKFGPHSKVQSCKGKVVELSKSKKAK